jgi:hypothetical protein
VTLDCGAGLALVEEKSGVTPAKCARGSDPMGRGRAKAKQTKVARELKYQSHQTDFGALAKELHGDKPDEPDVEKDDDVEDEYDEWSDYADRRSD